jgi:hypothetical protein
MIKRFHFFGIASLVAISALALAAQGFTLKRLPKEGQVVRYRMQGTIDIPEPVGSVKVRGIMEEKVTKVEADGSYTVVQSQIEGFASQGEKPEQQIPDQSPSTTKYNSKGEVLAIEVDADPVAAWRMAGLNIFIEPGKEVNVGDKWSYEIKADEKTGAVGAKAEFTVMGEEKVGSFDTVKVKYMVAEVGGEQPASSEGIVWLDKKDGNMIQADTKLKRAPFPTPMGTFPLDGSIKLTRIEG